MTRKELLTLSVAAVLPAMGMPQPTRVTGVTGVRAPYTQLERDLFDIARNCTCCEVSQ